MLRVPQYRHHQRFAYDCNHMSNSHRPAAHPPIAAPDLLDAVLACVTPDVRQVATHAPLFRQGDPSIGVFRLHSGRIRLVRVTPAGAEVALHTVRPGELFAEASLFSAVYHCDAVALRACEVLVYPKAELTHRLKHDSDALWAFAGDLARHVQRLRTGLELRQIRSASARVLQSLHLRCDAGGVWRAEGTLKQFAEEIGLTHEALYRALATLEKSGSIVRKANAIMLQVQKTPHISG